MTDKKGVMILVASKRPPQTNFNNGKSTRALAKKEKAIPTVTKKKNNPFLNIARFW
ncbi:MAG: hypothetical protein CM15mP83_5850 [Flavobacteriaceae bacterium]|nr:MAG: hypothetical protein CM15mP83_5850 [Flavobacteriaceae bacterium]